MALRPPFLFWQVKFIQVFPLKPALFCKLSTSVSSTKRSAISLLFSLYPLRRFFFYLKFSVGNSFHFPLRTGYSEPTDTHFSRETTRLMSWAGRVRCGFLLQSHVVSPLTTRMQSSLFSEWRSTVSPKFFDTQVPSVFTEQLLLPRHSRLCCKRLQLTV